MHYPRGRLFMRVSFSSWEWRGARCITFYDKICNACFHIVRLFFTLFCKGLEFCWGFAVFRIWVCLAKPFEIKLGLRMSFQGHCFCKKSNIEKAKRCLFVKNHVFRVFENPLLQKYTRSCSKNRCKFQDRLKYQQLLQTIFSSKKTQK